ncbi:hypothetical protein Golob_027378, partial [Gossypium lobatum]|nr:hypothetical protein [Gossypium lobatum]
MLEFVGSYTEDPHHVKLLVFNDSLGAVVYPSIYIAIEPWTTPEKYFHFWVMNGEAWTKQFSIESVPELLNIVVSLNPVRWPDGQGVYCLRCDLSSNRASRVT